MFQMRRIQFPIRLAFSMTINRSQGQTLDKAGIFLPSPVFANGQLYVGLLRGKEFEDVTVLVKDTAEQGRLLKGKNNKNRILTRNVVYLSRTSQLILCRTFMKMYPFIT